MRFIDADELINQGYEIVVDGLQYDTCDKSIDIDDIPTAYDIDKTIKELEGLRKVDMCESGDCPYEDTLCCDCTQYRMLDKAIEIVKKGGVRKDVE